jgi:hypothetical protein
MTLGIENNQESGVVDGSGVSKPFFGPATEDYYDSAAWAMVPATKSIEYIPDANILSQKRESDEPPFIKPTPNQYYLPALLTMLHTIPLFRNAFLAPQVSLEDYWLGEDWWKEMFRPQLVRSILPLAPDPRTSWICSTRCSA